MSEIETTITEQLQQLQLLMHRTGFHGLMGTSIHNPYRGQGRVLAILKLKPEISQKELTYLLNMSKQSLAELLAKLERSGYITREASVDDPRSKTIKLTEEGAKFAQDTDESAFDMENILDCLNADELAQLSEYLSRIIKRYEEQFPDIDYEQRRRMMDQFMSRYGHNREFGGHGERDNFRHGMGRHQARGNGDFDDHGNGRRRK